MRVLLVTHYYAEHRGGVEIVAGELAGRLTRRGLEVLWFASGPADGPAAPGVVRRPMWAWNVTEQLLGFPYPLWGPAGLLRLAAAVRRADVVHLHDSLYLGNVAAFCYARWLRKPVVVTQHIGMVPYSRRLLRGLLALANHTLGRLVLGGCTRAVFISPQVRDYFARFVRFRRPPLYQPNGVDTGLFRPADHEERRRLRARLGWPADRPTLLFVGRFVEKKGLTLLRRLAGQFPACDWVFVGWGPDDPARWGLPNVRCAGQLGHREIVAYYQAADLFVLPSVGEGFPLVVQEAMACGTPALISADTAGGMPGIEAVAYASDLEPGNLDRLLRGLLASPAELHARRAVVAEYARRHWDWEACAEWYRQLFTELAEP